jgi:anti-sigma regulatory factor (Ser/Thr protein kinase)
MTGATVRESVKVAGLVERARVVRSFVGAVLGPGHPCQADAVLLASELFGNSLRHSSSGVPGETVTVTVTARADAVRVEVADRSGPGCRSCARPARTRRTAGGSGSWLGLPRGGGGVGVAGGR